MLINPEDDNLQRNQNDSKTVTTTIAKYKKTRAFGRIPTWSVWEGGFSFTGTLRADAACELDPRVLAVSKVFFTTAKCDSEALSYDTLPNDAGLAASIVYKASIVFKIKVHRFFIWCCCALL